MENITVGQHKGIAHLRFDKNHKLDQVSLDFGGSDDDDSGGCFKGFSAKEAATRSAMLTDISENMLERFGKPVNETGPFPTSRELTSSYSRGMVTGFANSLSGKRIWRTEGQVIEEWFQIPCGSLFLIVSYKPQMKNEL